MNAEKRLAEGCQKRADRNQDLADAFEGLSTEATEQLEEPPAWSDDIGE